MIKIYRKSNLCAKIKMTEDGSFQVSARKSRAEASGAEVLERRFDNWTAATRFIEEIASDW